MESGPRRARDLALLDAIDGLAREALAVDVWRVVPAGRDPTLGHPSLSRWCDGSFDVLYTSLERDGAIAEIHALLSSQPVFPSKIEWFARRLRIVTTRTLRLADLTALRRLGVDEAGYAGRGYERTRQIADAALFLGFDGLIAPSARWPCHNLVLFTDRTAPDRIELIEEPVEAIDWQEWRRRTRAGGQR